MGYLESEAFSIANRTKQMGDIQWKQSLEQSIQQPPACGPVSVRENVLSALGMIIQKDPAMNKATQ